MLHKYIFAFFSASLLACALYSEQTSYSLNLHPDALGEQVRFVGVGQRGLHGEEGAVVAMMMYPAANDIDLVNLSLPNDMGRLAQDSSCLQQLTHGLLHMFWCVLDAALLDQAPMTDQEEFVALLARGGIDDQQVVGLNRSGDELLTNQHLVHAADGIA